MTDESLMDGPTRLDSDLLRKRADRLLLLREFAVAYEYPATPDGTGFLSVWIRQDHVETTAPQYIREAAASGEDPSVRTIFSEMAGESTDRIEEFLRERQ